MSLSAERDAMLRLTLVPGLGPVRVKAMVDTFGSARWALSASADDLAALPGLGPGAVSGLAGARALDTGGIWRQAERVHAVAVAITDPEYPELLRHIYDPPPLLWVRGQLPDARARLVSVVGTRKATPYGREMARRVAGELARAGIGVVSGMALGIDGEAHRAALDAGGTSIGVLGNGIDRIYPSAHRELALRMVADGCLVSELLPGTPSAPGHFPRRNRIIAGMSTATVVVEAHERGGALVTARLACDQNREVFAMPGPMGSPASRGTHALVRDGEAALVVDVQDMILGLWPDAVATGYGAAPATSTVSPTEARLLDAIAPVATPFEEVCAMARIDVSTALAMLLDLEFRGFVRQLAGRQFLRTALADTVRPWTGMVKEALAVS